MKKILIFPLVAALIFSAAGCGKTENKPETTAPETTDTIIGEDIDVAVKQRPLAAVSVPATITEETDSEGNVLFRQVSQHIQLTIADPEVAEKVKLEFLNRVDQTARSAEQLRQQAISQPGEQPYEYALRYEPKRIDQGILSLYGVETTFDGKSHPNYHCVSANYELITGEPLTIGSILVHENALPSLRALLLAQLSAISKDTLLWDNYKDTVTKRFEGDMSLDESWFFSENGLCFYFDPYDIASYASGIIIAEIPYEKLTGIMADEFFPAEPEATDGTITVTPKSDADLSQVSQIAELILEPEAESYMLMTDTAVQNLCIIQTDPVTGENYQVFAMQQLTSEDALRIQVSDEIAAQLSYSYISDDASHTAPLV